MIPRPRGSILAGWWLCAAILAVCGASWLWLKLAGRPASADAIHLRLLVSRLALLAATAGLGLAALWQPDKIRQAVRDFFLRPAHPLNLAVFRVVVFGALFFRCGSPELWTVTLVPSVLQFPPLTGLPEWGPLARWPLYPFSAQVQGSLILALQVASLLAAAGLFTRTAALVAAGLSIVALGAPYFFGKANHGFHYLVWCALLLGFCPAGDALSLDALLAGWRRKRRGEIRPVTASAVYRLPLAFALLLMAATYFFPGFWKVWIGGVDWALSDNFRLLMHHKWFETAFLPLVRFDHFPLLTRLGACAAVLFELAFVVLIFSRAGRVLAASVGLVFHTLNILILNIVGFFAQMACYVLFVDWHALARRFGLARAAAEESVPRGRLALPAIVGSGLFLLVCVAGMERRLDAWPIAAYPMFALPARPYVAQITMEVVAASGAVRSARFEDRAGFSAARWQTCARVIRENRDAAQRERQWQALWELFRDPEDSGENAVRVRFVERVYPSAPERRHEPAVHEEILAEWEPGPASAR